MARTSDSRIERWRRVEAIVDGALDLGSGERAAYLARVCPDPVLRAEVEEFFHHFDRGAGVLDRPAAEHAARLIEDDSATEAGRRIGAYRILCEAGHGGMGTVYVAERADDQYRKQVALKLIRGGLALDALLVRR